MKSWELTNFRRIKEGVEAPGFLKFKKKGGWNSITYPQSVRTHRCKCGFAANRDYNAALNILRIGMDTLQVSTC